MSDDLAKAIRNNAIDNCIEIAIKWRDDFKICNDDVINTTCYNVMRNFIIALSNLKNK